MSRRRDIRRCALQALYQLDAARGDDPGTIRGSLVESPGDDLTHDEGFALANAAWEVREAADAAVAELTPQWPTHRQPVVDRSLLRLAYYEMTSGAAPPKVAINEAVELAKEYSTDQSPMFVNGVLDKLYRVLRESGAIPGDVADDADDDADNDAPIAPVQEVDAGPAPDAGRGDG